MIAVDLLLSAGSQKQQQFPAYVAPLARSWYDYRLN